MKIQNKLLLLSLMGMLGTGITGCGNSEEKETTYDINAIEESLDLENIVESIEEEPVEQTEESPELDTEQSIEPEISETNTETISETPTDSYLPSFSEIGIDGTNNNEF